jgi:hypothetical protein
LQVVFAQQLAERMPKLLEAHQGLAGDTRTGVGHHLKRTAGKLHPVIVSGQKAGKNREQEEAPHHFHYLARARTVYDRSRQMRRRVRFPCTDATSRGEDRVCFELRELNERPIPDIAK